MLIIKITKNGKTKYYGAVSLEIDPLSDTLRRVKMCSSTGLRRIADI